MDRKVRMKGNVCGSTITEGNMHLQMGYSGVYWSSIGCGKTEKESLCSCRKSKDIISWQLTKIQLSSDTQASFLQNFTAVVEQASEKLLSPLVSSFHPTQRKFHNTAFISATKTTQRKQIRLGSETGRQKCFINILISANFPLHRCLRPNWICSHFVRIWFRYFQARCEKIELRMRHTYRFRVRYESGAYNSGNNCLK